MWHHNRLLRIRNGVLWVTMHPLSIEHADRPKLIDMFKPRDAKA